MVAWWVLPGVCTVLGRLVSNEYVHSCTQGTFVKKVKLNLDRCGANLVPPSKLVTRPMGNGKRGTTLGKSRKISELYYLLTGPCGTPPPSSIYVYIATGLGRP